MKECTLQEACSLTKRQGGVFSGKDIIEPYKYHFDEHLNYWIDESGNRFYLEDDDFEKVWLYEPPTKSAFQEWSDRYNPESPGYLEPVSQRRVGWNAALEVAKKATEKYYSCEIYHKAMDKLKEV